MDKKNIESNFKDCSSAVFMAQLEKNDKQCGTSASLEEGMEVTLKSLDYIDGHRTIGQDDYDKVEASQKHRYVDNGNGTYTVDNSYYAVVTEGAVSAVSFRTLTSAAAAPSLFPDCVIIPAGRASQIASAIKPYLGQKFKVSHVEEWKAGDDFNGRTQRFDGKAVGFVKVEG